MKLLEHDDKETVRLKKALRVAMDALDWYGDIVNYDDDGKPNEVRPGVKAASALSKIRFILREVRIEK